METESLIIRISDYAAAVAYAVFLLGGLLGLLIRPTRNFLGMALYAGSFAIGLNVWLRSVVVVYQLWGLFAVIMGLLIAGIGVAPMALAATAFHGEWTIFGYFLVNIALAYGCRGAGLWLTSHSRRSDSEVTHS